MRVLLHILLLVVVCNLSNAFPRPPWKSSSLRLVHVLFRHGNRNPDISSLWEGNPYRNESFYPEGYGQLTNEGKRTEYNLGKLLRQRYDSFLGDTWNINLLDVRSTNVNRTKMSAELVLAGLWPPKGDNVWNDELPWLPIPYNYVPVPEDNVLQGIVCPGFNTEFAKILASPENANYLKGRYGEALKILNKHAGLAVDNYSGGLMIQDGMKVQSNLGFPLPEWTKAVYPQPLNSLVVDLYYLWTNTSNARQIIAGNLIKKILGDSQSFIDGTIAPSTRKMFLYSAHDMNVGAVLLSLEALKMTQTPPYGAAVLFELHEFFGVYGIKLFYVDYKKGSPHPLTIPGCLHFCPIDRFYSLVEEILPVSDVAC